MSVGSQLDPKGPGATAVPKVQNNEIDRKLYRVVFFASLLFIQVIFIVLTFITRDTLFLKSYGKDKLPFAILSVSFMSVPFLTLFSKMSNKHSLNLVAASSCAIISISYFLFYHILEHAALFDQKVVKYTAACFYVWSDVAIGIMLQQFWEAVSSSFKISERKVSINRINFGSTLASLFIGFFLIKQLEAWNISTVKLILLLSALACLIMAAYIVAPSPSTGPSKVGAKPSGISDSNAGDSSPSGFSMVLSKPYYIHMCLFEIFATIGRVFADVQMLALLSKVSETEMKTNLGYINGYQSLFMLPLQASTAYINRHFGVLYGVAFLPLSLAFFGGLTASAPSMTVLIVSRSMYNAVMYTVFSTSRELLWLPLTANERRKTKPVITGTFRSVAKAGAAFLSMALKEFQNSQQIEPVEKRSFFGTVVTEDNSVMNSNNDAKILGIFIFLLSIVFLFEVLQARVSYATEFYHMLGGLDGTKGNSTSENIRPDVQYLNMADPVSKRIIRETLSSGTPSQRVFLLSALPLHVVVEFRKELKALIWGKSVSPRSSVESDRLASMTRRAILSDNEEDTALGETDVYEDTGPRDLFTPIKALSRQNNAHSTPQRYGRSASVSVSPVQRRSSKKKLLSIDGVDGLTVDTMLQRREPFGNDGLAVDPKMNTAIRLKALEVAGRASMVSVNDLLMLICNSKLARPIRLAAIGICGNNKSLNAVSCTPLVRYLEKLVGDINRPRTLRVSAAICLLKITDWMHEASHILLYEMLHASNKRRDKKSQVAALSLVGIHLSEMISDGYLIFILNGEEAQKSIHLLTAAIKSCMGVSGQRRSKILVPSLVKKLAIPAVVDLTCDALLQFSIKDTFTVVQKLLGSEIEQLQHGEIKSDKFFVGISRFFFRVLALKNVASVVSITKALVDTINRAIQIGNSTKVVGQKESSLTLTKAFAELLRQSVDKELKAHMSSEFEGLLQSAAVCVTNKLKEFHAFLSDVKQWSAKIVLGNIRIREEVHFLLQLCALNHFPKGVSIDLLLEGVSSPNEQLKTVSFEILDNLLQGNIKLSVRNILSLLLRIEETLLIIQDSSFQSSISTVLSEGKNESEESNGHDDNFIIKMHTLENSSLFQGLRLKELNEVAAVVTTLSVKKGDVLSYDDEKIYIIVSGKFRVKEGESSMEATTGQSIGEPPLSSFFSTFLPPMSSPTNTSRNLSREMVNTYEGSAKALTNCLVLQLTHAALGVLLTENSRVLQGILRTLLLGLRDCVLLQLRGKGEIQDSDVALQGILKRHVLNAKNMEQKSPRELAQPGFVAGSKLAKCIKLSRTQVFAALDHNLIEELSLIAEEKIYYAGDIIYREGDSADTIYVAERGSISEESGDEFYARTNYPRELYGELALLPQSTRTKTVYVCKKRGSIKVLKFSSKPLLGLMARFRKISQAICVIVASRLEIELAALRNYVSPKGSNPKRTGGEPAGFHRRSRTHNLTIDLESIKELQSSAYTQDDVLVGGQESAVEMLKPPLSLTRAFSSNAGLRRRRRTHMM